MSARERLRRKLQWAVHDQAVNVLVPAADLVELLDEPADIGGTYDPDDIHIPSQGKFVGHQLMRILSHSERQQSLDLSDYYEPTDDVDELAAARRQGYQDAIDLLRSRCEDFSDAAADLLTAALTEGKDSA